MFVLKLREDLKIAYISLKKSLGLASSQIFKHLLHPSSLLPCHRHHLSSPSLRRHRLSSHTRHHLSCHRRHRSSPPIGHSGTAPPPFVSLRSLSLFCACRCVPPSRGVGRPFDRQRGGCECCRASEREGCLSRTEPSGGLYSGHRSSVGEGTRILQSVCTPTKGLHTYLYVKILVIC
ncbi:hypothetical protein Hdeb2414_s0003g00117971 [Helianthus debilis subsp. tardiflorus]